MMRISSDACIDHSFLMLRCPVLSLKLEPPRPDISQIRIRRYSPAKPNSCLVEFAFSPEQSCDGADNQGVFGTLFEGIG